MTRPRSSFSLRATFAACGLGCLILLLNLSYADEPSFQTAMGHFLRKDYSRALPLLEDLTRRNPTKGLYWFNLGNTRFELKDFAGAAQSYEAVIRVGSPLAAAAKIYLARARRKSGQLALAISTLKALKGTPLPPSLQSELQDEIRDVAAAALKQGLALYDLHQYNHALAWFNGAIVAGAETELRDQAVLMRAMALYRLRRFEEAQRTFTYLKQSVGSESIREKASLLLSDSMSRSAAREFSYWGFIDFSAGYDSNIYKDGHSESPVQSALHQLSLGGGYRYINRADFSASLAYALNWSEDWKDASARTIQNLLRFPLIWENEGSWFGVTPILSYEIALSHPYLLRTGTEFSASKKSRSQEMGLDYSLLRKSSLSSNFDYLSGWTHELRGRWSFIGARSFVMPWLLLTRETAQDLEVATGNIPIACYSISPGFTFVRELGNSNLPWEWGLNGSFSMSVYDNISNPGNVKRRDQLALIGTSLSHYLMKNVKFYGTLTFLHNHSTLKAGHVDDKNYEEFLFTSGVTWELHP